ncbi:MAG: HEAT repeat domain-containing protein [Pyrinomonadaceae bacterium]
MKIMNRRQRKGREYEMHAGERVLRLVGAAAEYDGQPVSFGELAAFAAKTEEFSNISLKKIKRHVHSLVQAGRLVNAGSFSGTSVGRFLYALPGTKVDVVESRRIVRPHQIVNAAFVELWNERTAEAENEGCLPKPVLTGDINRHLSLQGHKFDDKRTLPNALIHLSQVIDAPIRKVTRPGEHFSAWAPSGIADAELNLSGSFGSDSERIKIAVERACRRLNRAVSKNEVMVEFDSDPSLTLKGAASLSVQLNGEAKEKAYVGGRLVERNFISCIRRAGQTNGKAFYFYGTKEDETQYTGYVLYLNLKLQWEEGCAARQLEEIEGCPLPTVAAGRALLVVSEARKISGALRQVMCTGMLNQETQLEAELLGKDVIAIIDLAEEWIKHKCLANLNLPLKVSSEISGFTSDELLPLVQPFYPAAKKAIDSNKLVGLLAGDIRRIKNPAFRSRFGNNPNEAAQFLFDRTDALLMIAKEWGGLECSLQAMLAIELGNLRDAKFVIPALTSPSFDVRFSAVACLAFLQDLEGNKHLRECLLNDPDPDIRHAAVWAYAFTQQQNYKQLLFKVSKSDINLNVRKFAEDVSEIVYEDLWRL